MKCFPICLLIVATLTFSVPATSQNNTYILNGSARQDNCNCYTLTKAANDLSGSVWNATKIDLNNSFDFIFNVYLGCKDGSGADGIVFILQPINTNMGAVGQGMGFYGVVPSVGIALDTWQNKNLNDPSFDHISIQVNGNGNHSNDLVRPVQASATSGNIEDCKWHTLRITWDANTHWLRSYFDDVLRIQAQIDLIAQVFNNDPMVYWGFGAATGAYNNEQRFCTAMNPSFKTNLTNNAGCAGNTVEFQNQTQSFASLQNHYWDFGDGFISNLESPSHLYATAGIYTVKLVETGLDGCQSDTVRKMISIGDYPIADFEIFDTCANQPPRVIDRSSAAVGTISQWNWKLDGREVSTSQVPQLKDISAGTHTLELSVSSNYGCTSAPVKKQFNMKPAPVITANAKNGCVNIPVSFHGEQTDNATVITGWHWNLANGEKSLLQDPIATYGAPGYYNVEATATGANGCVSNTATISLFINQAIADAGNDTVILRNQPFQLNASGGVRYNWAPANGINDTANSNPIVLLDDDASYILSVTTAEGCKDDDVIHLKIFRGSDIKVPSAFTPNHDGLNEILRPIYKGIKRLEHFSIYNRWGQLIFFSNNLSGGWDGRWNGSEQATGVYIWRIRAYDYARKAYDLKGTITLIR